MKKQTSDRLPIGAADFWQRLYLDSEYLNALYLQGMGCEEFKLEQKQGSVQDGFSLCLYSKPKLNIPAPLRKVLGSLGVEPTYMYTKIQLPVSKTAQKGTP